MSNSYRIPFANHYLEFQPPPEWLVDVAEPEAPGPPLSATIITERLIAFAEQLAQRHPPDQKLVFVFTDATRTCPDQQLLEPVVRYLQPYNFSIEFLCAVGMHRPSTQAEKLGKLGAWLVDNFPVVDHDPQTVVTLGVVDGIPVEINPRLLNATVVSVGVVEPHQYAGYSGGVKTAIIGCGGPNTIAMTHGPRFLDDPNTRLGNTEANPFQGFLRQASQFLNRHYAINVILSTGHEILDLRAGTPAEVHNELVKIARTLYEKPVPNAPYDSVIAGVGAPKSANLYQASRAATYIGLCATPIIRRGGVIIVAADLPEGAGQGQGERNFMQAMLRFGPTHELIDYLRDYGCRPGEQRAYMIAQLRQKYRVIMCGAENPLPVLEASLDYAPTLADALHAASRMLGQANPRLLIVPHALQTLPVPAIG
jgi:nickel-dependent lactate racemase